MTPFHSEHSRLEICVTMRPESPTYKNTQHTLETTILYSNTAMLFHYKPQITKLLVQLKYTHFRIDFHESMAAPYTLLEKLYL